MAITKTRKIAVIIIASAAALAAVAASILIGPGLSPGETILTVAGRFAGTSDGLSWGIVLFRVLRVAAAVVVGVALASAGCSLQALLKNPLADPYILGISSGAGFGAALATVFGLGASVLGMSAVNAMAFAGGIIAISLAFVVARGTGILSVHALLLSGVMVGAFFTSMVILVMSLAPAREQHAVFLWLMGDLGSPDISFFKVGGTAFLVAVGLAFFFLTSRALDVMTLGDEAAYHLGLSVERMKVAHLAAASLVTAAVVALAGPIGFVGLVVPHAMRRVVGPGHGALLAASVAGGAFLLVAGDTLVRVTSGYFNLPVVPVGVFTAFIGAPYFLIIMRRKAL
jgi:iron complex transport system permease protein